MSSSHVSIAYLKIFALGFVAVAHGFVGSISAFAQQSGQSDFSTQSQEYSEEEYLREIEELEALYDQYLAEEGNDEIAIFPEDGAFGRNVPDPIRGQTSEIFITPNEQDVLTETILTEQATSEVDLLEEEIIKLIEGTSLEPAPEVAEETEDVPQPIQGIAEVEETDTGEEAVRESEIAETSIEDPTPIVPVELAAPVSEEPGTEAAPVVGLVEEILGVPATENLAVESLVVEETAIEEIASEPTSEVVEEVEEIEVAPERVQEIVAFEEADIEEEAVRESEIAETSIEDPTPIVPVELAAPVSEEPVSEEVVEGASPEPTQEIAEVEEADVEGEAVREDGIAEIVVEGPAPLPIAPTRVAVPVSEEPISEEIVGEVSPEPTLEVSEETEAAPEPTQGIVAVEEADIKEETFRENEIAETAAEDSAPVAPVEVAASVRQEAISEEVVGDASPEPTLEVAEETEAAPEPTQEIVAVEEAGVEDDSLRGNETAETAAEDSAPVAPVEVAASVGEEPVAEEFVEAVPVVDTDEGVLIAPVTENLVAELPVVGEVVIAEIASEPVPEIAEEIETAPESASEIIEIEETDAEEEAVRESEIVEVAIEDPASEEAPVELVAPVGEELVAAEVVEPAPAVGFVEGILRFVTGNPVAESPVVAENASEPVPEEVVEKFEAAPELAQEIVEEVSPESTQKVTEETKTSPEPTLEIAEVEEVDAEEGAIQSEIAALIENLAPVAPVEIATPVGEELVAEEVVEVAPVAESSVVGETIIAEVVSEPTPEIAEEIETAPEPVQEGDSSEPALEITLTDLPIPLAPIRPVEVVAEIVPGEESVSEVSAEPVEVAVEATPGEEPTIKEIFAEESLAAGESADEVDGSPSLQTTIADAFTNFLAATIGFTQDPEQLEGVEAEEVEIVERYEPVEPVIPAEAVVEITSAEESVSEVSAEPVEVAVEATPGEELAPEAPAEPVEVAAEATSGEELAPEAPAEPVEVAAEATSGEEFAPEATAEPVEVAAEATPAEEPTLGEIVIEESPIVEEQSPVLVAEESSDEVDEPPSLQTTIGNLFASFFSTTIGTTQDSEQLEIAKVEETEIIEQPEPVEQVDPIVPIELVAPVEPVEPVESIAPVEPVELAAPVEPVEPVELVAPVAPVAPVEPVEPAELAAPVEPVDVIEFARGDDGLSLFEQVAVTDLEETDYASGDIFASIASENTSEKPQTGGLTDLALFQAPPEQGSFDPYPDSTIEAPGETLLAMGEVFTADENETYPTSSGEFGRHDPAPDPNNPPQGIFGGKKGISLFNTNPLGSTSEDVITGLSVNSFLWRATLDVLAFMPLASADPFGGVIITEWHNNPQAPNERFKVVAYILDKDLRVGALRVSVFRQEKTSGDIWADAVTDENIHIQLETAILSRARDLRAAWLDQQDGG